MASLLVAFAVVAILVWAAGPRRLTQSGTPLHAAFTTTAAGIGCLVTGALGYGIRKTGGVPYLQFIDAVVWEQIWWGVGFLVAASFFWYRALRTLGDPPRPSHA